MISKNQIKLIQSLSRKKKRDELKLFVAEGAKLVNDLKPYFEIYALFATEGNIDDTHVVTQPEMSKITHLSSASNVLAVFKQKKVEFDKTVLTDNLCLALDGLQDPGNLGTIIRVADWFGIRHVLCSKNTVDVYNTKTIQSTMGALSRVNIYYVDLPQILTDATCPIYGTFMDGANIYETSVSTSGIIVMGNEGQGISSDIEQQVSQRISIPSFGDKSSESLNVAMATGIVCSEFRRR